MWRAWAWGTLLLLGVPAALALPPHPFRRTAIRQPQVLQLPTEEEGPSASWFEQPLDQFDAHSSRTWRQRYFVNATFFDGTGPVFLCVGTRTT